MDEGGEWLWLLLGEEISKDFHIWISLFSPKGYQKWYQEQDLSLITETGAEAKYPNQRSMQEKGYQKR